MDPSFASAFRDKQQQQQQQQQQYPMGSRHSPVLEGDTAASSSGHSQSSSHVWYDEGESDKTLRRRSSGAVLVRRRLSSSSAGGGGGAAAASVLAPHEPWAGWSTVVKVLYAIIVPGIIIYLLARIEPRARTAPSTASEYHHHQHLGHAHHPLLHKEQSQPHLSLLEWLWRGRSTANSESTPSSSMAAIQQTAFDGFLLFGDSITQYSFNVDQRGFGAQLAHHFQRRLDVINRGFSGYTTDQAIHLLPQLLPQHQKADDKTPKIQFMTLFFGANDSCLPDSPQHVPLDRYEHQLRALVDMVHEPTSPYYAPWTKIFIICPPVVDFDRWAQRRQDQGRPMDRSVDRTQQYAQKCREVAQSYQARNPPLPERHPDGRVVWSHQVHLIDTWTLMNEQILAGSKTLQDYLFDGLHLNSDGNELIYQELIKLIRSKYSEWDPEVMPMHAPWWGNLDKEHPETDLMICANKRS